MAWRSGSLILVLSSMLIFSGCSRDHVREMSSLKDAPPPAGKTNAAAAEADAQDRNAYQAAREQAEEAKEKARELAEDKAERREGDIETGSVEKSGDCQGPHIAYQATKDYLKNFGPKPADAPGEKGPCVPH